jgi:ubiquinone/menaquinone biosynthesis C-methylase UbiE
MRPGAADRSPVGAVGLGGEVVALDGQREMLETLERRLNAEDITNIRPLLASLAKV